MMAKVSGDGTKQSSASRHSEVNLLKRQRGSNKMFIT